MSGLLINANQTYIFVMFFCIFQISTFSLFTSCLCYVKGSLATFFIIKLLKLLLLERRFSLFLTKPNAWPIFRGWVMIFEHWNIIKTNWIRIEFAKLLVGLKIYILPLFCQHLWIHDITCLHHFAHVAVCIWTFFFYILFLLQAWTIYNYDSLIPIFEEDLWGQY